MRSELLSPQDLEVHPAPAIKQGDRPIVRAFSALKRYISTKYLLRLLLVFLAYWVAGKLGQATTNIRSSNLGPVWPAYGIALAAFLMWGYRVWPGVATAAFLVAFFSPVPYLTAIGQAAGATVAAMTGAFLLRRFAGFNPSLSRLSDALSLIAVGGFGSATVSASIGVLVLYVTQVQAYSGLGDAWLIYWLGDATGVLLVTPLALRFTDLSKLRERNRIPELVVFLLLLAATCLVIFSLPAIPSQLDDIAFSVLPFVIFAAIRFGVAVTALSTLIVATIATVGTALGVGPFARHTTFENAVLLDVLFSVLSISGLSLAAVIAEREYAERERAQVVSKQAAMEARLEAARELQLSEQRWHLAARAGRMYAYEWDVATDTVVRSGEVVNVLGTMGDVSNVSRQQLLASVHPDDRAVFTASVNERTPESPDTQITYRILRPDGSVIWLEKIAHAFFDVHGRMLRMVGMVADVTERKQNEERLREYEKAVEGSEEMIAVVDRHYRYLIANRKFLSMRKMTRQQVLGHSVGEVLNPGIFETVVKEKMQECFQGRVIRYEMKYAYPEIGERDILVSYFPIEGAKGVDQIACIFHDITERKRAEEALRASEERLRLAQQAAHVGTFEWNIQTGVDTWTPELEAIHGLPPGGFGGTQTAWENLVHPDDLAQVLLWVDEALRTRRPMTGEWRVIWPDGSVHWIAARWQVLITESGEPLRMVGVNLDVTERRQAQETMQKINSALEQQTSALQSREELLKIFVKNVPAGVAMLDREMRYLQVSDRFCADYSLDSSKALGRSHYELFPDQPERWKEVHRRALAGETVRADEDRWDREEGAVWVRWEVRPWRNSDGLPGGILIFAEDITRRKKMEEALAGMSRKLIEAQEQERTRIARELHDDINQRLALLSIEMEIARQNPPNSTRQVSRLLDEFRKHIIQVSSQVQSISHQLHSSQLEYLGVVAAMDSFCCELAERQNLVIDFKHDDLPKPLSSEVSLCLFRILQEALHNAARHSNTRRFEVKLGCSLHQAHLMVSDQGSGFDVEAATNKGGLGLISMRERIRLVGGTIVIDSKPMAGTTVNVCVPLESDLRSQRAVG